MTSAGSSSCSRRIWSRGCVSSAELRRCEPPVNSSLPEGLRMATGWGLRDTGAVLEPSRIHIPVTQATVDCGVYLDGGRLPGRYTHAAAQAKVSELARDNGEAFVWI